MKQFATPHCHPQSLDSASTVEDFAAREAELGSGALTCTDHGTLAAAYSTYEQAHKHSLTPIIGLEAYFRDDDCPILQKMGIQKTHTVPWGTSKENWAKMHPDGTTVDYAKYYHLTLHFRDYAAYQKAVKLISRADVRAEQHGSERKALFSWNDVEEIAACNVTATSSCLVGMVQRHLCNQNNVEGAKAYFDRMNHLFGDRFYVEVFPHRCTHDWVAGTFFEVRTSTGTERQKFHAKKQFKTNLGDKSYYASELVGLINSGKVTRLTHRLDRRVWSELEQPLEVVGAEQTEGFVQNECTKAAPDGDVQWGCNQWVLGMAKKHGRHVLISDDAHFATPDQKIIQDVRLAQHGNWRFHGSYHRRSSQEAWEYFSAYTKTSMSEFEGWIDNSHEWVSGFKNFKWEISPKLPTTFFPTDTLGHTKSLVKRHGRAQNDPVYIERLKQEIKILNKNDKIDLLPYFFIDEEICRLHENQGKLTGPGRGSAAGLLLSYYLGITHVDPIKYGLSLDRFITPDRIRSGKLPDIDQDLPSRDLLTGMECDVVEFEADDGTKHILPLDFKVETQLGPKTIQEIAEQGIDIEPWWK